MKIQILGSGAYPLRFSDGLSTSLFLPEHGIVFDAGFGFTALPKDYRTEHLHILLSHFHHDHILGLAFLANVLETGMTKKVTIWGDERIEKLQIFFQEPFNPDYTSKQMPIDMAFFPEEQKIGAVNIKRRQVPHASGKSNMYRISDGKSDFVFSTDTTASEDNADFIQGASLLFHECNYDNASKERATFEGHSYPEAVGKLAVKAKVPRLVLIHTDPRFPSVNEEIQKEFPGAEIANDGMIVEL